MKYLIAIGICVILLLLGIRIFNFLESKLKEKSGWKTDLLFFSFMIFVVVIGIISLVSGYSLFNQLFQK